MLLAAMRKLFELHAVDRTSPTPVASTKLSAAKVGTIPHRCTASFTVILSLGRDLEGAFLDGAVYSTRQSS